MFDKRTFLMLFLLSFLSVSCKTIPPNSTEKKPNIIFIMADDLGWKDVSFMGSNWFETPNLDKLAKESMVFNQAYMYPTCSPSRAALLTGKQSFRTGVYTVPVLEKGNNQTDIFSRWTVGLEHPVYAKPLNEAGYKLIHLGKWHIVGPNPRSETKHPFEKKLKQPDNGDMSWVTDLKDPEIQKYYPKGRGFHENVGGSWWGDPAKGHTKGYKSESGGYNAPFKNPMIEPKDSDEWLTDRLTDEAIDFIDRNKDEPFFVNLHFYSPHRPFKVRNKEMMKKFRSKIANLNTKLAENKLKGVAAYATMIASIDENIQRIVDYLDEKGLRENTIIVFTSDNGYSGVRSARDRLRGAKGFIYEGGIRVPALVNWRGKIKPGRTETPISGLDYFPTFLELAGVNNYKELLDGESIVPLLKGKQFNERPLFWHVASTYRNPPCSVIRKGDFKLIQFLNDGKVELYDLEKDVKESKNLLKEKPEIAKALLEELTTWRKENKVPLPPASSLLF